MLSIRFVVKLFWKIVLTEKHTLEHALSHLQRSQQDSKEIIFIKGIYTCVVNKVLVRPLCKATRDLKQ